MSSNMDSHSFSVKPMSPKLSARPCKTSILVRKPFPETLISRKTSPRAMTVYWLWLTQDILLKRMRAKSPACCESRPRSIILSLKDIFISNRLSMKLHWLLALVCSSNCINQGWASISWTSGRFSYSLFRQSLMKSMQSSVQVLNASSLNWGGLRRMAE